MGGIRNWRLPGFWWSSLAAVLPSLALAALAAALDLAAGARVILIVLAANGLILCCFVLEPMLLRTSRSDWMGMAYDFLAHGQKLYEPTAVVESLSDELERAAIADRVLVAVRDAQGKLLLYGGKETDGEILAQWSGDLSRTAADPTDEPSLGLCSAFGCNRILPLRGPALFAGAAFLREVEHAPPPEGFWPTIAAHLSFLLVNRRLAGALQTVSGSLALATPLQQALMAPEGMGGGAAGLICHGLIRLTPHCGGDTWTSRELGDGKVLVFVGDATGHGPAAATLSVAVKGVVDGFAMVKGAALRLDELLAGVDDVVRRVGQNRYILSAIAAIVDLPRSAITIANAGHPHPFVVERRDHEVVIRHVDTGAGNLLGAGSVTSEIRTLPLTPGARWVFYTDGLCDARVAQGPSYGYRRFRDSLRASAHESAQVAAGRVMADVDRFTGGRPLDDDVVLLMVESPAEVREPAVPR